MGQASSSACEWSATLPFVCEQGDEQEQVVQLLHQLEFLSWLFHPSVMTCGLCYWPAVCTMFNGCCTQQTATSGQQAAAAVETQAAIMHKATASSQSLGQLMSPPLPAGISVCSSHCAG